MKYFLARSGYGEATASEFPNGEASPEVVQLTGGAVVMATRHVDMGWQVSLTTLSPNGTRETARGAVDDGGTGQRDFPNIAALDNGGYAVVWGELMSSGFAMQYRAFNADGSPNGPVRTAFADVEGFEPSLGDVIALPEGGFAIAANRSGETYLQTFRNNGTVKTDSVALETRGQEVALDVLPDGRILAIGTIAGEVDVIGPDGVPTGETLDLGSALGVGIRAEALAGGNTLLVGSSGGLIRGQIYNGDWAPVTGVFAISEPGPGSDVRPDVVALADGGAIVSWGQFGSGAADVQARRLDADGDPVGEVISIGGGRNATFGDIHVEALDNGNVVFVFNETPITPGQLSLFDAKYQVFSTELSDAAIEGTGGRDDLMGGGGADLMVGFGGNDVLTGKAGADALYGGRGQDRGDGNQGHDYLDGGAGKDTLLGGLGDDTLLGGTNRDSFFGGKGDDLILGGTGLDTIRGGSGKDNLLGGEGNDVIAGGGGADSILGQAGNDRLSGNGGADTILAGAGSDTVTGGGGADLFVFLEGDGDLKIRDFELDADRIDISDLFFAFSPTPESYLESRASLVDGSLEVDTGQGVITFLGVDDVDALAGRLITDG